MRHVRKFLLFLRIQIFHLLWIYWFHFLLNTNDFILNSGNLRIFNIIEHFCNILFLLFFRHLKNWWFSFKERTWKWKHYCELFGEETYLTEPKPTKSWMRKKRFFLQFYKLWHRLKEYTSVSFIYISTDRIKPRWGNAVISVIDTTTEHIHKQTIRGQG